MAIIIIGGIAYPRRNVQRVRFINSFLKQDRVDMNNWTACYPYGSYDDQSIEMLEKRM